MKTQKIYLGLLFVLTLGLFSSCTKHDRPAELSADAQTLDFNKFILERQFNVVNIGDELLSLEAYSDREWVTVLGGDVTLSYAQSSIIRVQINPDLLPGFGIHSGNLYLRSNGGNYTIPIEVDYQQTDEAELSLDIDYLKFTSNTIQDYFTLYNDGGSPMNFSLQTGASWVQASPNMGAIGAGGEQRIYVDVNRSGLNSGLYAAEIVITSSGGNAIVDVDMDVAVYSITLFNPVYTPMTIVADGFDPVIVSSGERHSYLFDQNPLSFGYTASTKGTTENLEQLGVEILWDEVIDVSDYDSPTFNLNVSSDYFYLIVKNTGNYNLNLWSINYDTDFQIDDDFVIPNDGVEYGVAYYEAFTDTDIYARLAGTNDDVKWSQGVEFVFPWVENQYVLLENNFKKSAIVRPGLKSGAAQEILVKPFNKPVKKSKGSIDLYNKK